MATDPSKQAQNHPTVPPTFKEGTKKYQVAKALLSGEVDRGRIVREVGVSLTTIYNVTGELAKLGHSLAIHQRARRVVTSTSTSTSTFTSSTPQTHQQGVPVSQESNPLTGQLSSQLSGGQGERVEKSALQLTGDTRQAPTTHPGSRNDPPASSSVSGNNSPAISLGGSPQQLSQDFVGQVADRVAEIIQGKTPPEAQLPGKELPIEDVELVGEKVNYKIALNPEIFYRYSVFKARVAASGKTWDGSLNDFIDMATKDILAVYGMYPTVMVTRGKSIMVEIPGFTQEGERGRKVSAGSQPSERPKRPMNVRFLEFDKFLGNPVLLDGGNVEEKDDIDSWRTRLSGRYAS